MNTNRTKMKQTFSQIKDNPDYQMIVAKYNNVIVGFAKAIIHHDIFEENNPFITFDIVFFKVKLIPFSSSASDKYCPGFIIILS